MGDANGPIDTDRMVEKWLVAERAKRRRRDDGRFAWWRAEIGGMAVVAAALTAIILGLFGVAWLMFISR